MNKISATRLLSAIAEYDYDVFGLRVLYTLPDDGSVLDASRVWIDGEPTSQFLKGVSAIGVKGERSSVENAIRRSKGYLGKFVVLLGGNQMEYGEDVGEIILRSAIVLERWKR